MSSEDVGAGEDLELNAQDAENVIGGVKKKKKRTEARKTPVKTVQATVAVTPAEPLTQAEMERIDKEEVEHGLPPLYGTIPTE